MDAPCSLPEILGVSPWRQRLREAARVPPLAAPAVRAPHLDLPFAAGRYDGIELDGR